MGLFKPHVRYSCCNGLWTASGGRYGLRSFPRGRARSYAVADLVNWVEIGMPTGYHREDDGVIRQVAFA